MAHLVFASYAQLDRDKHLENFIQQLADELRRETGASNKELMVFFDRDGVHAGDRFTDTILRAANSADTLLCLLTPTYFRREWCGRELEIFLRREKRLPESARQLRFIFPIWW